MGGENETIVTRASFVCVREWETDMNRDRDTDRGAVENGSLGAKLVSFLSLCTTVVKW